MKLLTRKQFLKFLLQQKTRKWRKVMLHHTAKPDYPVWKKKPDALYWATVIDRVHKAKGWQMIGYHFLIMPDGSIVAGRPLSLVGAHCPKVNKIAVGVCLFGNFSRYTIDDMPNEQYISAWFVLTALLVFYRLQSTDLLFHRQFQPTDCPGYNLELKAWQKKIDAHYQSIRRWLDDHGGFKD